MEELIDGLYMALVGMGVVFLSLTVLMFSISGLGILFRVKEEPREEAPLPERAEPGLVEGEKETVAAISVAIARAMEEERKARAPQKKPSLPAGLTGDISAWRTASRPQLMSPRERKRQRR